MKYKHVCTHMYHQLQKLIYTAEYSDGLVLCLFSKFFPSGSISATVPSQVDLNLKAFSSSEC